MLATTDGLRGVDLAAALLACKKALISQFALLRVIRDAATSGIAETSESDVPLACAATPSRKRRNDVDEDTAAANSA